MKKLLLSFALATAAIAPALAQDFSDYFIVRYDGKDYTDGQTIYINKYEDFVPGVSVMYSQHIQIINKEDQPRAVLGQLDYGTKPTKEEAKANPDFWSEPSFCHTETYDAPGGCLAPTDTDLGNGTVMIPPAGTPAEKIFAWDMHLYNCSPEANSTYRLIMYAMNADDPEEIESSRCTIYVNFSTDKNAAVGEISIDENAPVEYYNLQGIRVANPEKGIYIKRQGTKTVKVRF